jgi:hypothetical protein
MDRLIEFNTRLNKKNSRFFIFPFPLLLRSIMSSISSIPAASAAPSSGSANTLEKQKADLESQISAEQSSKDDPQTQALKIATLQAQVAQIDAEIGAQSKSSSKPDASAQQTADKKQASKQPDPDPSKFLDTSI